MYKKTGRSHSSQKLSEKQKSNDKQREMDHLFNAFMSRRASTSTINRHSCNDIPDLYAKRRMLKRTSFGSRQLLPSTSNSELVNVVDEQLMQIREKLAAFRQQDTQFKERMDSLNDSVSELASRSSISSSPSECSDLDSLDEVSEEEEFEQQTVGQKAFSDEPPRLLCIPTVKVTSSSQFNRPPVGCFHMRHSSDPSSLHSHIELPKEEEMETRRHSTYSADQAINLYPQYNNPEEISTLF